MLLILKDQSSRLAPGSHTWELAESGEGGIHSPTTRDRKSVV